MRTDPKCLRPIETDDPPLAGWRDASWHNHPGRSFVYHVATTGLQACCFRDQPLAEGTIRDAADVPQALRCRRTACAKRWPA